MPGNTCDGDLLSSTSSDSCRQVTSVEAAVDSPHSLVWCSRCTEHHNSAEAACIHCSFNFLMKENIPQVDLFQSWSLLRHYPSLPQFYAPLTADVGSGLKKPSNTIPTSEQEAESQFLSKQPWKWKMLQLCALSQQALMSLRHTDTKS